MDVIVEGDYDIRLGMGSGIVRFAFSGCVPKTGKAAEGPQLVPDEVVLDRFAVRRLEATVQGVPWVIGHRCPLSTVAAHWRVMVTRIRVQAQPIPDRKLEIGAPHDQIC
jgi:hypothetical protein